MVQVRQYPRVIVEGMDGAGKTFLARQLADQFDLQYVRNEKGPREDIGWWWMDQLHWFPGDPIPLNDRFFYPELVYGPVLRGNIVATFATVEYVSNFLRSYAFLIYCRPPIPVIQKGVEVEDQMDGVKDNFKTLLGTYDKLMIKEFDHYPKERCFKYDWTQPIQLQNLIGRVEEYLHG